MQTGLRASAQACKQHRSTLQVVSRVGPKGHQFYQKWRQVSFFLKHCDGENIKRHHFISCLNIWSYLCHSECLGDLMNQWFRVTGDIIHKLVRDLELRRSRQTVDILKPEAVPCMSGSGGDIRESENTHRHTDRTNQIWKLPNHRAFEQKKMFIPELLSVLINTWALGEPSLRGAWTAHTQKQCTWTIWVKTSWDLQLSVSGLVPLHCKHIAVGVIMCMCARACLSSYVKGFGRFFLKQSYRWINSSVSRLYMSFREWWGDTVALLNQTPLQRFTV